MGKAALGFRAAVAVVMAITAVDTLQDRLGRFVDAVVVGPLVERAVEASLSRRPVVAVDVDDERVVQLAAARGEGAGSERRRAPRHQ
ncbi:MAG: hypothetical protein JOZ93_04645 [Sinobacteraceae bacterium]|nr:hypothetical protein [Nevskiaceae bacterium]